MADLYGQISSDTVSNPKTGQGYRSMKVSLRGWKVGVLLQAYKSDSGEIRIDIYADGGSNNETQQTLIATVHGTTKGNLVEIETPNEQRFKL